MKYATIFLIVLLLATIAVAFVKCSVKEAGPSGKLNVWSNAVSWTIPSAKWKEEVMLLRDLFNLNFPDAWALLQKYGSAEAAFENHKCEPSSTT